jgi:GrpB-like predicted nucleotidyltransferase (UPF0157 family)
MPPLVRLSSYRAAWPRLFAAEAERIRAALGPQVGAIEHIGSTAIPGLAAKPIIDLMAGLRNPADAEQCFPPLERLGYERVPAGMPGRHFLRKRIGGRVRYHLHLVPAEGLAERNELLLRDYLRAHHELAQEYGALKRQLAARFAAEPLAYTRTKTTFVQRVVDRARDEGGLARAPVWEE